MTQDAAIEGRAHIVELRQMSTSPTVDRYDEVLDELDLIISKLAAKADILDVIVGAEDAEQIMRRIETVRTDLT